MNNTETSFTDARGRLADYIRDSEIQIAQMNARIRESVAQNLEQVLKGQLVDFSRTLDRLLGQIVQESVSNAMKAATTQNGFASSSLQATAELLKSLEKARRNL